MRVVAGFTALYAHRGMLEHKGPPLFRMALHARFFVYRSLLYHAWPVCHPPGGRKSAMRVVTVRADHYALVNAVLEWHRKLGADIGVTPIAKLRLRAG